MDPFSVLKGVSIQLLVSKQPKLKESPPATPPVIDKNLDDGLFLQAMDGVRRLDAAKRTEKCVARRDSPKRKTTAMPRKAEINPEEQKSFVQAISRLRLDVTFTDMIPDEDELQPLGANRLRQLKKGIIRLDRQLDLHGLTRYEALEALLRFLCHARVQKEKAVLVITGKGLNSPGEPVLLQAVTAWLRDAGREFVLEFAPAPREMGGSGAFVVFLRE